MDKLKIAREINRAATNIIKETAKAKIKKAREDPKVIALIIIDVLLIFMIIIALFLWFDPYLYFPDAELIPDELKLVLLLFTIFLAFWIYRYTEWYRKQ